MQLRVMDEKNKAALANPGSKKILADFMNLADSDAARMDAQARAERLQEFHDKHGPLIASGEEHLPVLVEALYMCALGFGMALEVKTPESHKVSSFRVESVNQLLDGILGSGMYAAAFAQAGVPFAAVSVPPAIRTDFIGRKWEPVPRTLLDALAIELVHSRRLLHQCEQTGCERYFVKTHGRDKTCSLLCSEERSKARISNWQLKHREELNQRRRKPKRRRPS